MMRMSTGDAVRQQPAGAFVTKVMPVQIDLPELGAIDASTLWSVEISTLRAYSDSVLNRLMTSGSSNALTGRSPKYFFKDLDASRGRIEAANSGGSQVTLEIGVEETRDMLKLRCRPLESREGDSQ